MEQRVVTLIVNCTKLTEQELRKALGKLLTHLKTQHQTKQPHGKMTVKKLAAQNRGLQSVEVTDQNIGSFNRIARKYGIDFAPFKAKGQDRYLIFFKSQDADAMTAAFKEYTEQIVNKKSRPSILAKLEQFKALIQSAVWIGQRKRSWNGETGKLEESTSAKSALCIHCVALHNAGAGRTAGNWC